MKTILEFINKGHIKASKKQYIEPYDDKINSEDLKDGDYFAITWKSGYSTNRACGIFKEFSTYHGVEALLCYCSITAYGDKHILDPKNNRNLHLGKNNDIVPVTEEEYEELTELYKKYLQGKK